MRLASIRILFWKILLKTLPVTYKDLDGVISYRLQRRSATVALLTLSARLPPSLFAMLACPLPSLGVIRAIIGQLLYRSCIAAEWMLETLAGTSMQPILRLVALQAHRVFPFDHSRRFRAVLESEQNKEKTLSPFSRNKKQC